MPGRRLFVVHQLDRRVVVRDDATIGIADHAGSVPLLVHQAGRQAVFADGSVHFLSDSLDLAVLKNLADRNDYHPVEGLY